MSQAKRGAAVLLVFTLNFQFQVQGFDILLNKIDLLEAEAH